MSKTAMDLDALRAAVLMSRKQPAQFAPLPPSASDQPDQPDQPAQPAQQTPLQSQGRAPASQTPLAPQTHNVTTTDISNLSQTEAARMITLVTAAAQAPSSTATSAMETSPQTTLGGSGDREEGEISDEGGEPQESIVDSRRASPHRAVYNQLNEHMSEPSAPQLSHSRPRPPTHSPSIEKSLRNPQLAIAAARVKGKSRSMDDNISVFHDESQPDFTTLMAEYQKAKITTRNTTTATGLEPTTGSDIPGLGLIRSSRRPFAESDSYEQSSLRHLNGGRWQKDRARSPKKKERGPQGFNPIFRPRDTPVHNRDYPPHIRPSQQGDYAFEHFQPAMAAVASHSSSSHISGMPRGPHRAFPPHGDSSDTQLYSLVEQVIRCGINPRYLVQKGIDPTVVQRVSQMIASQPAVMGAVESSPSLHSGLEALAAVASVEPAATYALPQTSAPLSPPFLTRPSYEQQAAPSQMISILPQLQQQLQQQDQQMQQAQQMFVPQSGGSISATSAPDDLAAKQLEMIMAYASQILPQGWDNLLQHRDAHKSNLPASVGFQEHASASAHSTHSSSNIHRSAVLGKAMESCKAIKTEPMDDQRVLWSPRGAESSEEQTSFTTAIFQGLAISPCQSSTSDLIVPPGPPAFAKEHNLEQPPLSRAAVIAHFSRSASPPPPPPDHPPPSPSPPHPSAPPQPPHSPQLAQLSDLEHMKKKESNSTTETAGNLDTRATRCQDDLFYLDRVPNSASPMDTQAESSSPSSQDDMETDIDMELDDGCGPSTILKGSWKTTENRPSMITEPSSQSVSKRPAHIRFHNVRDYSPMQIHSAPASMSNTPIDSQESGSQQPTLSMMRLQRTGRRTTAMDMMSRSQPLVPFVLERAQSYLIDLDDEDGDEPGGDRAKGRPLVQTSQQGPTNGRLGPRSLETLQQQLKELNDKIKAKERAKQAAASSIAANTRISKTAQLEAVPLVEIIPLDPTSESSSSTEGQTPNTRLGENGDLEVTSEVEELRRTLREQNAALDRLRSQMRECEQDKVVASESLVLAKSVSSAEECQVFIDEAEEAVAAKTRELEETKRHLEATKARVEPLVAHSGDFQALKTALQERVDTAAERTAGIKGSIVILQQSIIRMRTRLLILHTQAPSEPVDTSPVTDPVPAEKAPQIRGENHGIIDHSALHKRGVDPQNVTTSSAAAKKPRIQAREEFSVLSRRMQELERETGLLGKASTPAPDGTPSLPLASTNPEATVSTTSAPLPSQLLLQKLALPLRPRVAFRSTVAERRPLPTPDLSRLDLFLLQHKSLPVNLVSDAAGESPPSCWKPISGIKKLILADACLFELDQLCLPSEMIVYAIPDHQNLSAMELSSVKAGVAKDPTASVRDTLSYASPLTMFRSFRFSDRFNAVAREGYRSLTFSNKIDPMKPMCLYELAGGSCNDDSCLSQHARDYTLTDDELVIDMARYAEGSTPESRQVFADMQSAKLAHLRASGIHNVDLLVKSVVKNHREFVNDPTRTVKFGERVVTDSEQGGEAAMNNARPRVEDRTLDRLVGGIKWTHANPFDKRPIVMAILSKGLSGSSTRSKRYHHQLRPDDYERLVKNDPSNETLWIQFAMAVMSVIETDYEVDEANNGDAEDENLGIRKALAVLSRAIGTNSTSESLWSMYLDIYVQVGTEAETRQTFEECLQYIPQAQLVWFRYHLWEKSRDERVYVLDRMLEKACQEPREADDEVARSRFTLDVVLQIIKNMVAENFVETAKNWTQNFLSCTSWESVVPSSLSYAQLDDVWREQNMVENIGGTLAARLLTPKDLCILWLSFVYLIWFHELPEQLFLDHPNEYISDSSLFAIQWPSTEEPEQEGELHSIVHDIFLGLTVYFVDIEAQASLVAIVKNFVEFLMARGQRQEDILELINPSQFPEPSPEIRDLLCQVRMRFHQNDEAKKDLHQALQETPRQPYLWNRYACLLPDDAKLACLEQCAFEFFEEAPDQETELGRSELALRLYKKLLGLALPYSYKAPPTHTDIAPFRTNVFLWLNYLSLLALGAQQDKSYSQLESAFSIALDTLPEEKSLAVRTEFALHSIMKELDRTPGIGFNEVTAAAVGSVPVLRRNPYEHSSSEETRVQPLSDFTQLNRIVESVWKRTAQGPTTQLRIDILDSFLRLFPNNLELFLWMGEAEQSAGNSVQCRKVLALCLHRFPSSNLVWKRMMRIFSTSTAPEIKDFMMQASLISPLAARRSRMPIHRKTDAQVLSNRHMHDVQDQGSGSDMDMDMDD